MIRVPMAWVVGTVSATRPFADEREPRVGMSIVAGSGTLTCLRAFKLVIKPVTAAVQVP